MQVNSYVSPLNRFCAGGNIPLQTALPAVLNASGIPNRRLAVTSHQANKRGEHEQQDRRRDGMGGLLKNPAQELHLYLSSQTSACEESKDSSELRSNWHQSQRVRLFAISVHGCA